VDKSSEKDRQADGLSREPEAKRPLHRDEATMDTQNKEQKPNNIVLIISDQESFRLHAPKGYELGARAELRRRGTSFERHYISSAMCTPSRGVMFSGQPPQVNGVFDEMQMGYVPSLATDRPSMGTAMSGLGYETAYFGKFELRRDAIYPTDTINYEHALREYGFGVFAPDGDKTGAPAQGYHTDNYSVAEGNRWLRTNAHALNDKEKPWLLVISMINPHDIMYANANLPGESVQVSSIDSTLTAPPKNRLYEQQWEFPLSASRLEPVEGLGHPAAQMQYLVGWNYWLGDIPAARADMWQIFYNYYLNLLRDNDRMMQTVLDTLTDLDLWKSTIVVQTADHGEMAGSHGGLRGKGPFPFEEQSHVPFVIVHPEHAGGGRCGAVTSHIDLVPTLVGLTGRPEETRSAATKGMPGHDLSPLLAQGESAATNSIRAGALFNYVGLFTIDANYLKQMAPFLAAGKWAPPLTTVQPDLGKRGFLSFAFDGRYKFARYYAPNAFNTPETLREILEWNDIELFDLENDPHELRNLAVEAEQHEALILRMNALLNKLIAEEVGVNDGQFLPPAVRPNLELSDQRT
jgi:arylsulfatase A-like enzyme